MNEVGVKVMTGKVGRYLLSNHYRALPITLLCALSSFFLLPGLLVASIIITLFTLERGYKAGGELLFCVIFPFSIIMVWQHVSVIFILFFVVRYIFNWLLAGVYRKYRSWLLNLELMSLIGIFVILCLHLYFGNINAYWHSFIEQRIQLIDFFSNSASSNEIKSQVSSYAAMGTGLALVFVFLDCCFQILVASFWQRKIHGVEPSSQKDIIKMGSIFAVLLSLVVIGKIFGFSVASDCLPVILFPFIISGFSLLHFYASKNKRIKIALLVLYSTLIFGFPWLLLLPAALSYLNSFMSGQFYKTQHID